MIRVVLESFVDDIKETLDLPKNFDIYNLLEKLNGNIVYTTKLRIGIDAEIESIGWKDNKPIFTILVDEKLSESRKRMALARQLGHIFIHLDFLDDELWKRNIERFIYIKEMYDYDNRKEEASLFAFYLLN